MHSTSPHYRQLQPEDRMTLASLQQQNYSIRAVARVLHRSSSTISRELSRNADASGYASSQAQKRCQHRRQSARPQRRLHDDSSLFGLVQHFLLARWSPEQIALTLARIYPKGHKSRVSHETIYNCIYAQPVGELRRELVACLRQAHNKRTPRSKGQDRPGQIPDMLSIHVRPPEIEDRQFPGHWEGDLIKGEANASAAIHRIAQTVRVGWGQSIHAIMVADIHRDDLPVLNQQLQCDAVRQVDRHRMQAVQLTAQGVQAQRGMCRVGLQHLQGLEILLTQVRVAP
jgi:IS30 family transposase